MQQIKKNFISNILFLLTSVIVVLYFTPYLINSLGLVAYGIIPLTLLINQYITIFTGSLTSALSRFLSISIQRNRFKEASKYLSSALLMICFVILIFAPLIYLFLENIDKVFTIPKHLISEAKTLFGFTIASFFISLFTSIFNISQYAVNRLDLLNYIKSSRNILKFLLTVIFFVLINPNIAYIGLINFMVELLLLLLSIYFFVRETGGKILFKISYFRTPLLVAMLSMTIWSILHQFGDTFIYQMDVFFVNKFFNSALSGIVGTFINLGSYVIMVVSVISSLFGPYILMAYSKKDYNELVHLTMNTTSIIGLLNAVIVGVFVGFSHEFVRVWVGPDFLPYTSWLLIKLSWMPFFAASGLFAYVYRAHNKVRFPAIMTLFIGLVNVVVQYVFYKYMYAFGEQIILYGLIISGCFAFLQSYVLNAFCFNKLHKGNGYNILKRSLLILFVLILTSFLSYIICNLISFSSMITIISFMGLVALLIFTLLFCFILNDEQKTIIKNILF